MTHCTLLNEPINKMIPQEVIQQIIEKVDIVEWVEQYVPAEKVGHGMEGALSVSYREDSELWGNAC